jgi:phospholipid/cholesterol/gamma-HCH transport system substrate-binding protein
MTTSVSFIRTGAFVLFGVTALLVGIFIVGNQEGLFRPTFRLSAYFNSVEGVRAGSAVRMAGVDIGVVENVEVSPSDTRVRVDLKLNSGIQGFVKKDSYVMIVPEGLVGSYYVDLTAGSRTAAQVEDGDVIQSRESPRPSGILDSTAVILAEIRRASSELNKLFAGINQGRGTLGKLVAGDDMYRSLERITRRTDSGLEKTFTHIDSLSASAHQTTQRADSLVATLTSISNKLNSGSGTLGSLLVERTMYDSLLLAVQNVVGATDEANVGVRRFSENMEALKHHWLLRGFFEDRGYWDEAVYEKELDKKIDSLKSLQRAVTK